MFLSPYFWFHWTQSTSFKAIDVLVIFITRLPCTFDYLLRSKIFRVINLKLFSSIKTDDNLFSRIRLDYATEIFVSIFCFHELKQIEGWLKTYQWKWDLKKIIVCASMQRYSGHAKKKGFPICSPSPILYSLMVNVNFTNKSIPTIIFLYMYRILAMIIKIHRQ